MAFQSFLEDGAKGTLLFLNKGFFAIHHFHLLSIIEFPKSDKQSVEYPIKIRFRKETTPKT